jgi:hypothetical protein
LSQIRFHLFHLSHPDAFGRSGRALPRGPSQNVVLLKLSWAWLF